jgi:hypothetical protein
MNRLNMAIHELLLLCGAFLVVGSMLWCSRYENWIAAAGFVSLAAGVLGWAIDWRKER